MDENAIDQLRRESSRFLMGHYRKRPQQVLAELAAATDPDAVADTYGQGVLIADFEHEIAQILGKEAAVFMPSGTMCQQIALRIWTERTGKPRVAFHPTCHLEIHEQQGYRELHHLHGVLVGLASRLMRLADLQAIAQPLAALLIELPQREIGGQLPTWDDLVALTSWAREQGIMLHMDGARLWQCLAFYQRDYHEIAALFGSVYVSFYKDLGGIAGAVLAGPPIIHRRSARLAATPRRQPGATLSLCHRGTGGLAAASQPHGRICCQSALSCRSAHRRAVPADEHHPQSAAHQHDARASARRQNGN